MPGFFSSPPLRWVQPSADTRADSGATIAPPAQPRGAGHTCQQHRQQHRPRRIDRNLVGATAAGQAVVAELELFAGFGKKCGIVHLEKNAIQKQGVAEPQAFGGQAHLGSKGIFYRVRLHGFDEQSAAKSACNKLKSKGVNCSVSET